MAGEKRLPEWDVLRERHVLRINRKVEQHYNVLFFSGGSFGIFNAN